MLLRFLPFRLLFFFFFFVDIFSFPSLWLPLILISLHITLFHRLVSSHSSFLLRELSSFFAMIASFIFAS